MNKLEIRKITMHGFKNHEDLVEFDLGTHTKVSGANGAGKTTIGEAITWGLMGTDLTGNEKATTKLINHKCKDVYVELEFSWGEDKHTLIRRRKSSTISIILDDKTVKQTDLVAFYKDKELFLSIFNPTYFPSLTPKSAKAVLDSELEEVSKDDVYKKLPKVVVEALTKTGFGNPNLYMENQRARAKEITEELQYWNGFKEGVEEVVEIPEAIKFDDGPLQKLKQDLEDVNNIKITQLHDISDLSIKRDELRSKVGDVKSQIHVVSGSQAKVVDVSKLSAEVSSLRGSYTDKANLAEGLNNTVNCPKCETVIDLDASAKNAILEELEVLKVKGTAKASELKKSQLSNADIELKHKEHQKETLKGLQLELDRLTLEISELNVSELYAENEKDAKEQQDVINLTRHKLSIKLNELEEQKREAEYSNKQREDLIKRNNDMKEKVEQSKANINELEEEEVITKTYIDCAKRFVSKRLEIQAKQIDEHLDKVTIQLEKITQLGEVKPDFKILYDGKEFSILSNSERIKAGLEVANLLMNVSGLYIPIFVDNAESITDIPKMDTQMIEARVKEDTELTVEVA